MKSKRREDARTKELAPPPPVVPPANPPLSSRQIGGRVLRLAEVCEKTGLCRSTIYKGMNEGWFPKAIKLTQRASGWNEHEIDAYLDANRGERRRQGAHTVEDRVSGK